VSATDDFLKHYGVKGMKWGTRGTSRPAASAESNRATTIRAKAKTGKAKALSNAELREAIERMNLEQQFKRLSVNEKPAVQRWMASTLLEIGKREVQVALGKKVATTVAKKIATGGAG
jgi:hypothetical protein